MVNKFYNKGEKIEVVDLPSNRYLFIGLGIASILVLSGMQLSMLSWGYGMSSCSPSFSNGAYIYSCSGEGGRLAGNTLNSVDSFTFKANFYDGEFTDARKPIVRLTRKYLGIKGISSYKICEGSEGSDYYVDVCTDSEEASQKLKKISYSEAPDRQGWKYSYYVKPLSVLRFFEEDAVCSGKLNLQAYTEEGRNYVSTSFSSGQVGVQSNSLTCRVNMTQVENNLKENYPGFLSIYSTESASVSWRFDSSVTQRDKPSGGGGGSQKEDSWFVDLVNYIGGILGLPSWQSYSGGPLI